MAEDKKSVLLYCDLIHTVKHLPDELAGKLFKHFLAYINDEDPQTDNIMLKVAFEPIKQALKRDLRKWEGKRKQWSDAGKASAEAKKRKKEQSSTDSTNVESRSTDSTVSVNASVKVNVNDKVKDIKETKEAVFNFRKSLLNYGFKENIVIDYLKIRKNKKATNTETAFNSLVAQIEKTNRDKNEVFKIIVENGWSGFKVDWLNNLSGNKATSPHNNVIPNANYDEKL